MSLECNDPGVRAKGMIEGTITETTGTNVLKIGDNCLLFLSDFLTIIVGY